MRAALVAVAVTLPATLAAGPALADPATSAVLAQLPSDVALVASIDVGRVRRTRAFRSLPVATRRDLDKLGIERAWLAIPGSALGGARELVVVATTSVGEPALLAFLEKKRTKPVAKRAHGRTYHLVEDSAWAFVDGTIVVASAGYIERVLEQGGSAATDDPALAAAVAAAERAGGHAWMALVLPEKIRAEIRTQAMAAAFAEVRWIAGHLTVGRAASYGGEIRASSAADASSIVALLSTTMQMMGSQNGSLASLTFRADGASVFIAGSLTSAELDTMFKTLTL